MDIYAQEVSKMQSVSKTSAPSKKRNFDATQFNAYGLPLGKYPCSIIVSLLDMKPGQVKAAPEMKYKV